MIQEEYCTFETCKLLREAGFPQFPILPDGSSMGVPCIKCYRVDGLLTDWIYLRGNKKACSAPTQAQAMRWLRDALKIFVKVSFAKDPDGEEDWMSVVEGTESDTYIDGGGFHTSYEAAAEAGIQTACKYVIDHITDTTKKV